MDKVRINAIIVVEGTTDQAFLSTFIDADFVLTNGSEVSRGTLDYLKEASKTRDIIVLTDPDTPGKRIRDRIQEEVPSVLHAFVAKEKSIKGHKVGVAESSKEEVLSALSHLVPSRGERGTLTMTDLYELGLTGRSASSSLRRKVEEKLHLGHGNAKTLLKRSNALGLTKQDLLEAIDG